MSAASSSPIEATGKQHKPTIHATVIIQAPISQVRETFLDFSSYPSWNPFIKSLTVTSGNINDPTTTPTYLQAHIQPPGKSPMNFKPRLLTNTPTEFAWVGTVLFPSFLAGHHYFKFQSTEDGKATIFEQGEYFTGVGAPLFMMVVGLENTRKGFELMNEALKKKVGASA
jgi:hypothetical protein